MFSSKCYVTCQGVCAPGLMQVYLDSTESGLCTGMSYLFYLLQLEYELRGLANTIKYGHGTEFAITFYRFKMLEKYLEHLSNSFFIKMTYRWRNITIVKKSIIYS